VLRRGEVLHGLRRPLRRGQRQAAIEPNTDLREAQRQAARLLGSIELD
jgi:hypothetical protein